MTGLFSVSDHTHADWVKRCAVPVVLQESFSMGIKTVQSLIEVLLKWLKAGSCMHL